MTPKRLVLAISLVVCAALMLIFTDRLQSVGRYDAGPKWVILQLPYASTLVTVGAIPFLGRAKAALVIVAVSFMLFIPLFVHECLPGLIGLIDPAYRSVYGEGGAIPFLRPDALGCATVAVFLCVLAALFIGRRKPAGVGAA